MLHNILQSMLIASTFRYSGQTVVLCMSSAAKPVTNVNIPMVACRWVHSIKLA